MKYIVTIVALTLSIFTTNVMAGTTATINGTVVSSTAIMEDIVRNMPQDTCRVVEVPVYGNTKGSAGDAIAGAIIGGVLGNQVGKGSGKDAATIFGAILGAKAGENNGGKRVIVGYKQVEQCDRTYVKVRESVVVGYETQVQLYDDLVHSFQTTRQYRVGSTVPVRMTLSLN
jgi:uncharacterized protein YcfJ